MKFNQDKKYEDEIRPRLKGNRRKTFEHFNKNERRILVIGDLHLPFTLPGYLEFCKEVYSNWNCNQVIYIGDILDNVLYEHGEGGQASRKAQQNMMSSVCGHTHTSAYVMWFVGKRSRTFAMQVGCGVDSTTFAAAYAKNFKKQAISCGVVIGGNTAINLMMDL